MCLRSSTGLGAKEGREKKRLLVARVLETLSRLARRARTAMRQPRQMCGEGIGGGNIALHSPAGQLRGLWWRIGFPLLGCAMALAMALLSLQTVAQDLFIGWIN